MLPGTPFANMEQFSKLREPRSRIPCRTVGDGPGSGLLISGFVANERMISPETSLFIRPFSQGAFICRRYVMAVIHLQSVESRIVSSVDGAARVVKTARYRQPQAF